ncbi:MAG: hypothetical protein ABI340_04155 [Nitrososphaera sp.]|jgi:uncharacterized membrane protein required for colicin V production
MRGLPIFAYISVMWILIIIGGGLLVFIIAPISITGYGKLDHILDSGVKAVISISLVVAWIFIMSKIKNWIFQRKVSH